MTAIKLNNLLDAADFYIEDHYVIFRAPNSVEGRESLLSIELELENLSFKNSDGVEEDGDHLVLAIDTGTDSWSQRCPLFFNTKHFWGLVHADEKLPEMFFICDIKLASWHDDNTLQKFKAYFLWKSVLRLLADHKGTESSPSMLVFFVSKEKSAKVYEVNPTLSLEELGSIGFCSDSYDTAREIKELIEVKDAHARERKDVLRTTLSDLLDEEHTGSSFKFIISQFKRYQRKFGENYDVYVHQFSVNKLLGEIEEKVSDYISKVNESVSSSQNKAFAIPGALIAIAALIRSQDFWSIILVCVGLYFVMHLTRSANEIFLETFETLENQVRKSLSRYEVIKDEDEVRISAEDAKKRILHLIGSAKRRVGVINNLALGMFVCGSLYGIILLLEKKFPDFLKVGVEWFFHFLNAQPYFTRFV